MKINPSDAEMKEMRKIYTTDTICKILASSGVLLENNNIFRAAQATEEILSLLLKDKGLHKTETITILAAALQAAIESVDKDIQDQFMSRVN